MIYLMTDSVVVPGKMAEFNEIVGKEMQPLWEKVGIKGAGSWHAYTGNMNEVYQLFVFENLAAYAKVRDTYQKNKAFNEGMNRQYPLLVSRTSTFLEPNPWSPLK